MSSTTETSCTLLHPACPGFSLVSLSPLLCKFLRVLLEGRRNKFPSVLVRDFLVDSAQGQRTGVSAPHEAPKILICFPVTIASFMIRGNFLAHRNVVVVCC